MSHDFIYTLFITLYSALISWMRPLSAILYEMFPSSFIQNMLSCWMSWKHMCKYQRYIFNKFGYRSWIPTNILYRYQYSDHTRGSMFHKIHKIFLYIIKCTIEIETVFTFLAGVGIGAACTVCQTWKTCSWRRKIIVRRTLATDRRTRTHQTRLITYNTWASK